MRGLTYSATVLQRVVTGRCVDKNEFWGYFIIINYKLHYGDIVGDYFGNIDDQFVRPGGGRRGFFGYFLSFAAQSATPYLLPFAAGGFIYIAASDLMPEIRKERVLKKSVGAFLVFLLGIAIMFAAKFIGE